MNLTEIVTKMNADLREYRPDVDHDNLDFQIVCVCEETGELAGAYRRWAGKARRPGTLTEVADEVADVLIVTTMFALRAGISIDDAIAGKVEKIYSRGWGGEK